MQKYINFKYTEIFSEEKHEKRRNHNAKKCSLGHRLPYKMKKAPELSEAFV